MARRRRNYPREPYESLSDRPYRPSKRTVLKRPPQVQTPVARRQKPAVTPRVKTPKPAFRPASSLGDKRKTKLPRLHRDPKIIKTLRRHRLYDHPALIRRKQFRLCVERIRNEGRLRFQKMKNRIASSGGNYKKIRRKTDEQREVETLARIAKECR